MTKMYFYTKFIKSIKVDGSSKKDEKFIESIEWMVHPRRMTTLLSP